jgi:hypothetical protein
VILDQAGRREVARVSIDGEGNYQAVLDVGRYIIDINHAGIDSAQGLPADVEINAGQVTRLDLEIDTGIR